MSDAEAFAVRIAAELARRFEGFFSLPYLCPAGIPTIGYGFTYYMDGRPVRLSDPVMSKSQAELTLLWLVRTVYLPAVLKLCPQSLGNPEQLAALIDFTFNLGAGNLKTSTLRKRINAGDRARARIEIMKWVRGGGRVLRGLVLRRQEERNLI